MLIGDTLAERRREIADAPDLSALLARLRERARPLIDRTPEPPAAKALLSTDGGVCPRDAVALAFDPWSPEAQRCPRCGEVQRGVRHHRWWARFQHLWLAERIAHLAALAALGDDRAAGQCAAALIRAYGARYPDYPNRDNVLGPSRPFFSTYLESIWITSLVAGAVLLREAGALDEEATAAMDTIADGAAELIGEFNEGFSNRQTWHAAALAALSVWFEDEELLRGAVEGPTGLAAHAAQGFGADGMWYEGENYHLFALRGLLVGLDWVRAAGLDPFDDPAVADRVAAAALAPAWTALPDGSFPARKDSRFGISLAQPMYLELFEAGRRAGEKSDRELADWLAHLYRLPAPPAQSFDAYLHESGEAPPRTRGRRDLSWWMLATMLPSLPERSPWRPASVLLETQGLAVLRRDDRYVSLECGAYGGGHGHPDRLHLTLHDRGVHWLPDPGTGSYVSRDLFWYRSTLAHNAPLLDGESQAPGDARCEYFDAAESLGWVQASYGPLRRTTVVAPDYLLDLVELTGDTEHLLELPWHLAGVVEVTTDGRWEEVAFPHEFVAKAERFLPAAKGPVALVAAGSNATLRASLTGHDELLRLVGPGAPDAPAAPFLVARARGARARLVTALSTVEAPRLDLTADAIEIALSGRVERHQAVADGWQVEANGAAVLLSGHRPPPAAPPEPLIAVPRPSRQRGVATWTEEPPSLDGTLTGFDLSHPLTLDHEDQYRRSEEPYGGPELLSATAYAAWDDEALYLAVDVTKPDLMLRPSDAPPLRLDNEPDDIHSDGLQVYVMPDPDGPSFGALIVPDPDAPAVRARGTDGQAGLGVSGSWARTEAGYLVTLALRVPGWDRRGRGDRIGFDLLINEARPDRERRAGQLVWSGGGGWVWLRGDRQSPHRFGSLELR